MRQINIMNQTTGTMEKDREQIFLTEGLEI